MDNLNHIDRKEVLFKEIDLIQDIIRRMAHNSFLIKGWTLTLVIGVLLIRGDYYQGYLSFIPLLVFWFLDSYFLWQERLYRKLYNYVVENRLNSDENIFDMNAYRFKNKVQSKARIMFSNTLGWFYGSILFLLAIYFVLSTCFPIITGGICG